MSLKTDLPELNTLWVGGVLSYIELLSIKSAQFRGHKVNLYTYYGIKNVPDGVEIKDARDVLPEEKLLQHVSKKKRSYSLGSNIFRYEMLRRIDVSGYWVDLDVVFVKPLKFDKSHIFGWESESIINGAILNIPSESLLLQSLLNYVYKRPCIPPWWPIRKKLKQRILSFIGKQQDVQSMKWGVFGPKAITHFAKETKLDHMALAKEVFYPIHWKKADLLFDPQYNVEQHFTEKTVAVHLWNEAIKQYKSKPPPEGCFVYKACRKHGIDF